MPSPTTTRGLLGLFPQGADPPTIDTRATTLLVRSPTYLSLQEILTAGAGGRSARGGASGCRGPREEGRSGTGERSKGEGWSGRRDDALDAEMEEDRMPAGEQGWGYDMLTASPWGTQENSEEERH